MKVGHVMVRSVLTCELDHPLSCAAKIMWESDCGSVAVVDAEGKVIGMVTDRDICMAAYTRDLPLSQMTVGSACSNGLIAVLASDSVEAAERLMQLHRVRRLPVVDVNDRPIGMLSISDLVRSAGADRRNGDLAPDAVIATLAAIGRPHSMAQTE
ncbi:MAG TPA: CBS domain-containing protein [Polyangiaceae bacterium]